MSTGVISKPINPREIGFAIVIVSVLAVSPLGWCQWTAEDDRGYVKKFEEQFPPVEPLPALVDYIAIERYDTLFMGKYLDDSLKDMTNDSGRIAWGTSYQMMSLNEMARATGDRKYIEANLRCIQATIDARDDRNAIRLWNDTISPCWSSVKYAERGRAVFAVHTGMIVYPVLDCLDLIRTNEKFSDVLSKENAAAIQTQAMESLLYHDPQWRDGPEEGAGYYVGLNQENSLEGKPLPGNRLSAMGRALWIAYKLTGKEDYKDRALAIAQYIKNRLGKADDGAYYWSYQLPVDAVTEPVTAESVSGEDVSHGSLTMSLPIVLANENLIFTKEDMQRLCTTVEKGFARLDNGVLFGSVNGDPSSNPAYVQSPSRWLYLSVYDADVYRRLAEFYLKYKPDPGPIELALLIRFQDR